MRVSGAKNSALPLMFATLLTGEECILSNVPDLEDISTTLKILRAFGAETAVGDHVIRVRAARLERDDAPHGLVKAMRASFLVLGPVLARMGSARVPLPGGDAIGTRPVDIHLHGLAQLGADLRIQHGMVVASAPGGLEGATIGLEYPSVGATEHLLMTASLIAGETILRGAAREPEIVELAQFLSGMGVQIEGAGSDVVRLVGRRELGPSSAWVLGDRIEAATYLAAGAVSGGRVTVRGIQAGALSSVLGVFQRSGCEIECGDDRITLRASGRLEPVSFNTAPFPGVATDVQPLLMAALTTADGESVIEETVFESRFGHVLEYRNFGAEILVHGQRATVRGVERLKGSTAEAGDIRAAAGLVIMGLMAEGRSELYEIHHLDRGYESLVEKLRGLGGELMRVPAFDTKEVIMGC